MGDTGILEELEALAALGSVDVTIGTFYRGKRASVDVSRLADLAADLIQKLDDERGDAVTKSEELEAKIEELEAKIEEIEKRLADAEWRAADLEDQLDHAMRGDDQ